jgi:hypothetical protein
MRMDFPLMREATLTLFIFPNELGIELDDGRDKNQSEEMSYDDVGNLIIALTCIKNAKDLGIEMNGLYEYNGCVGTLVSEASESGFFVPLYGYAMSAHEQAISYTGTYDKEYVLKRDIKKWVPDAARDMEELK